jgi:hypothetical protein
MRSSRDQFRDHFGIFAPIGRSPEKKKARGYGLFKWSECTDLNRGPLVPQKRLGCLERVFRCGSDVDLVGFSAFSILFEVGPVWGGFGRSVDQLLITVSGPNFGTSNPNY